MTDKTKKFVTTFSRNYQIGECLLINNPEKKLYNSPQDAALSKKEAKVAYIWEVEQTHRNWEWKILSFLGSYTVNLPQSVT